MGVRLREKVEEQKGCLTTVGGTGPACDSQPRFSLSQKHNRALFLPFTGYHFPRFFLFFILIPAYYILVILAIMITLSMHHHPLSRWEQPVAICGSPSRHSFHITTGHLPVNAQMNIGVLFERYERNIMSSGGGYALCWIRRSCEATIDLILSGRDCSII